MNENNSELSNATNITSINASNNNAYNDGLSSLIETANTSNFNGDFGDTSVIDNRIAELKKQFKDLEKWTDNDWYYDELHRKQREALANDWKKNALKNVGLSVLTSFAGPLNYGAVHSADVARKVHSAHNNAWENAIEMRKNLLKQIQDAEAQKMSYLANIQAQRDKYKNELKGLEKVGVKNPYMVLRNGTIGSSAPYSLSGMGAANFSGFSKPGGFDKEAFIKILIALLGAGSKIGAAVL